MSKKLKELCNGKYQGLKKFKKGDMINMNKIENEVLIINGLRKAIVVVAIT